MSCGPTLDNYNTDLVISIATPNISNWEKFPPEESTGQETVNMT